MLPDQNQSLHFHFLEEVLMQAAMGRLIYYILFDFMYKGSIVIS